MIDSVKYFATETLPWTIGFMTIVYFIAWALATLVQQAVRGEKDTDVEFLEEGNSGKKLEDMLNYCCPNCTSVNLEYCVRLPMTRGGQPHLCGQISKLPNIFCKDCETIYLEYVDRADLEQLRKKATNGCGTSLRYAPSKTSENGLQKKRPEVSFIEQAPVEAMVLEKYPTCPKCESLHLKASIDQSSGARTVLCYECLTEYYQYTTFSDIKKWKKVGAPRTYFSNDKIHFSVRSKSKYGPPLLTEEERAEVEKIREGGLHRMPKPGQGYLKEPDTLPDALPATAPTMKVSILSHTPNMDKMIASSARVCYAKGDGETLFNSMEDSKVSSMIRGLIAKGHGSTLEHGLITFSISGISRVTSHQLVRKRHASYSQQSQRYVEMSGVNAGVLPPSIESNEAARRVYSLAQENLFKAYRTLAIDLGIPAEDARYLLPGSAPTNINVSMNPRSLLEFFEARCCERAQWEIRELANEMLRLCKEIAPVIFENAGPACMSKGICPEKEMTCGRLKKKEGLKQDGK